MHSSDEAFPTAATAAAAPAPDPRSDERWSPLRALAELVGSCGQSPGIELADFSYMGCVERRGLPRIYRYRHDLTRRRLDIDDTLHAWRYAPTTPGAVAGFIPLPSLADAVEALDLVRGERLRSGASPRRFVMLYADEAS